MLKPKSTVYLCLQDGNKIQSFVAPDGRSYFQLWMIKRRLTRSPYHFMHFRMNGERVIFDPTAAHFTKELPRSAVKLTEEECVRLHTMKSHYFGIEDPSPEIFKNANRRA
jgi:hypothetical protein